MITNVDASENEVLNEHRPRLLRELLSQRVDEHELEDVLAWLNAARAKPTLETERVSLRQVVNDGPGPGVVDDLGLKDWVVFVKSTLRDREVMQWTQPLLVSRGLNLCGLLVRRHEGRYDGLMQIVEEPGIIEAAQIGPTVQVGMSVDRRETAGVPHYPLFAPPAREELLFDVPHSEEGGRFFRDTISYRAVYRDGAEETVGPRYRWVGLSTLKAAITIENTVNIHARTLLCMLA